MSWNDLPIWDKNRPIYLKLGLVMSLSLAYLAMNYTGQRPEYLYLIEEDSNPLFQTPELRTHREFVDKQVKVINPSKPVNPLTAVIVTISSPPPEAVTSSKKTEIIPDLKYGDNESGDIKSNQSNVLTEKEVNKIFISAERMPALVTCREYINEEERRQCTQKSILEYVYKHLKYPSLARETGIEGTVIISFIIDKNGKMNEVEIKRDIGGGCGSAAKMVIKGLNNWEPGYHNDRAVNVKYTIPIRFKLNS
ncbi:MAG: energy transducer TonB [Saprospiraceae bacterium]|nr:energy transducer TonB [Saprospiraceae bacterium]